MLDILEYKKISFKNFFTSKGDLHKKCIQILKNINLENSLIFPGVLMSRDSKIFCAHIALLFNLFNR